MPRRPPLALGLGALLLASACASSGPASGAASGAAADVAVPAVNGVSTSTLIACRAFKAALPPQIAPGAKLRAVTPVSDTTAAYGDPPVTVRCGVRSGSPADDPYTFNDVAWAMHDDGASRAWTTTGRKVNVVVEVPDAYSSQAELIGRFAPAVKAHLG